jgi:hypothetical protein
MALTAAIVDNHGTSREQAREGDLRVAPSHV